MTTQTTQEYKAAYEKGAREAVATFRKMFNSIIDNWENSMDQLDKDRDNGKN